MASRFVHELTASRGLDEASHAALAQSGIRSPEDLHSLAACFPSASRAVPRLAELADAVTPHLHQGYRDQHAAARRHAAVRFGAGAPAGAPFAPGSVVAPRATAPPRAAGPGEARNAIDLRLASWPVLDQGDRLTCVAFGTAACVEHMLAAASGAAPPTLAPQFLFWSIKTSTSDPHKDRDSAALAFAREALAADGICTAAHWAYGAAVPDPISGQTATDPSAAARADAAARRHAAATFEQKPAHAAARVRTLLAAGRPVAITLPVFRDPASPPHGPSNWGTEDGWSFGGVLDPPPHSVAAGGHCVCVTGFVPDDDEPHGGWFVVRNSWGADWAHFARSAAHSHSPERGYGEVSASYVESCCWELMQL